jgi:methionyl-tRNA formyltransferase
MKIIFAGTPAFSATALEALKVAGYEIALVLTQPDRPAGRGMKAMPGAVKVLAKQYELPLLQPYSLNQSGLNAQLDSIHADAMVVVAYGLIVPPAVLALPRYGCLNIHASLLPRWRGAAPIQRAILAGDRETGITIIQMDKGLDTGDMLLQRSIRIECDDTAQTLHDKLSLLGADCIIEALTQLQQGNLSPVPQTETGATYAPKLKKDEARINWGLGAEIILRAVRAFNPWPGAYTIMDGSTLKIWRASIAASTESLCARIPGEVAAINSSGITVACGEGSLILEVVQKSGGKKMNAAEFVAGHTLYPGDLFESGK